MSAVCGKKEINWKLNLFMVWLGQILSMAGFAAITPFIPLFIKEKYNVTDEKTLGLYVASLTFFGMFSFCVSAPIWGMLADKYGRKLMLLRAYFVTAFIFPTLYWAPQWSSSIVLLIAIRFVVSMFSGTTTAAQTLLVTNTPKEHHGFVLGTLSTSFWCGNMIGFLAGAMLVHYLGYLWSFIGCGAMYLIGGILTYFFVHENFTPVLKDTAGEKKKASGPFSSKPVICVLMLFVLMGMARRFDEPYIAMRVASITAENQAVFYTGIISMVAAVGGFISGIFMGRLCDKISPFRVAVPAALFAAVTMVIQALAPDPLILGGARFMHFTFAGGLEPAFLTLLAGLVPPEQRGRTLGWASSMRMSGVLAAALCGAGVIYFSGTRGIFLTSGILFILLLLLLYAAWRSLKHIQNPKPEKKGE